MRLPSRFLVLNSPLFVFTILSLGITGFLPVLLKIDSPHRLLFSLCGVVTVLWLTLLQTQLAVRTRAPFATLPAKRLSFLCDTCALAIVGGLAFFVADRLGKSGAALPACYAIVLGLGMLASMAFVTRPSWITTWLTMSALLIAILASIFTNAFVQFADTFLSPQVVVVFLLLIPILSIVLDRSIARNWRRLHERGLTPLYASDSQQAARELYRRASKRRDKPRRFRNAIDSEQAMVRNLCEASSSALRLVNRPIRYLASLLATLAISLVALSLFLRFPFDGESPSSPNFEYTTLGVVVAALLVSQMIQALCSSNETKALALRFGRVKTFTLLRKALSRSAALTLAGISAFALGFPISLHLLGLASFSWTILHAVALFTILAAILTPPTMLWLQSRSVSSASIVVQPQRIGLVLIAAVPLVTVLAVGCCFFPLALEQRPDRLLMLLGGEAATVLLCAAAAYGWLLPNSHRKFLTSDW